MPASPGPIADYSEALVTIHNRTPRIEEALTDEQWEFAAALIQVQQQELALITDWLERRATRASMLATVLATYDCRVDRQPLPEESAEHSAEVVRLRNLLRPFVDAYAALFCNINEARRDWYERMPGHFPAELTVTVDDCRAARAAMTMTDAPCFAGEQRFT